MTTTEISIFFPLAQGASGGGGFGQFLPIILLFVGMWFLIIAPQRKRQKATGSGRRGEDGSLQEGLYQDPFPDRKVTSVPPEGR